MKKLFSKSYVPIIPLVVIFIIDFLLIILIHYNWNESMRKYFLLKTQIENIKSEISLGHLWVEERLAGDKTININRDIILNLSHYDFKEYLSKAKRIFVNEEKEIYKRLVNIDKKSDEFLNLAKARLLNEEKNKIGSFLDQRFDEKFAHLLSMIIGLNYSVDEKIKQELDQKEGIFILIVSVFLIANFIAFIYLFKYRTKNKKMKKILDLEKQKTLEHENLILQQSKMVTMTEMLENIIHHSRQPLSLITITSSGLKLKKEMALLEDGEFYKSMDLISNSTIQLSKSIDNFKDFFKSSMIHDDFLVDCAIEKALVLVDSKLKNKNIELIKKPVSIKLNGLENEFIHVLMILLNNSIDALEKQCQSKMILIDSFIKDGFFYIVVNDSAGGIDEEIQHKVFDAHFSTKHNYNNTGMGLYMAKEIIIRHMSGEISFENKEFSFETQKLYGASFTIKLPYSKCNI